MAFDNDNAGSNPPVSLGVVLAVYMIFVGVSLTIICAYKLPRWTPAELASTWGGVLLVGVLLLLWGALLVLAHWRRCKSMNQRPFWVGVVAACISILLMLGSAEALLRILVVRNDQGVNIGNFRLSPTWPEVAERNHRLLQKATPSGTWEEPYLVFDRDLGWVVGKDRATGDGMYISSAEGIRSGERGVRLAERRSRYRIAIVGDSNAFALEVKFEDSWGYHLEKLLGADVQVLNFGVNGYGLDQAVLRYERDVRPLAPDLVILAFIQHDLIRSMAVYPFVSFPTWTMPFAKPRFVLGDVGLTSVNTPLTDPGRWFDGRDLADLPNIDLDLGYRSAPRPARTEQFWVLGRFVTTLLPRYPPASANVSQEEVVALNAAMLVRFYAVAAAESAVAIAYVPTAGAGDFEIPSRHNQAREMMARTGLSFFDLTECLRGVADVDRRVPSGAHYSPLANREIARCMADELGRRIDQENQDVKPSLRP